MDQNGSRQPVVEHVRLLAECGNLLSTPVPQVQGDIANIVADLVGNQTITGPLTVGSMNLGDMNGASTYTIGVLATTDVLTFDNSFWAAPSLSAGAPR